MRSLVLFLPVSGDLLDYSLAEVTLFDVSYRSSTARAGVDRRQTCLADELAAICTFRGLRSQSPADRALQVLLFDDFPRAFYLLLELLFLTTQLVKFSIDEMGVLADIDPYDLIASGTIRF